MGCSCHWWGGNSRNTRSCADYRDPAFSRNGDWLAFAADFSGQHEIWKATVGTYGSPEDLTQLTQGNSDNPARAPAWSSDGNWLVFQRDMDDGEDESWQLYIVQADDSSLRDLGLVGEVPDWYGGSAVTTGYNAYLPLLLR